MGVDCWVEEAAGCFGLDQSQPHLALADRLDTAHVLMVCFVLCHAELEVILRSVDR